LPPLLSPTARSCCSHRTNIYAFGALLLLGAIGKWFTTPVEVVLILVALGIINLPVRYSFTTQGIACNNVLFRKWKEFEYARYHRTKLTLMPRKGFGSLPLYVLASRQDEVLPYFQRFLQVRMEAPPPFRKRSLIVWLRRRLSPIAIISLLAISLVFLLSACGENADPSGLEYRQSEQLDDLIGKWHSHDTAVTQHREDE